jgi:signal transduction histidine kinase
MVPQPNQRGDRVSTQLPAVAVAPQTAAPATWRPAALRVGAWSVVAVYLGCTVAYLVLAGRLGGAELDPVEGVPIFVGFGFFAAMGALLITQRPASPLGWLLAGAALLVVTSAVGDLYAAWVMTTRGRPDALAVLGAWLQSWCWTLLLGIALVALPLLFPDGRLPSRRWLWMLPAGLAATGVVVAVGLGMLAGTLHGQEVDYRIDNPIGVDGLAPLEELPVFGVLSGLLVLGMGAGVAAVVVRFRRSRGQERQQMKWFLYATAPVLLLPLEDVLPWHLSGVAFAWVLIALPVAVAIAVLRYRLDGIDVVLNRTLVYVALTAVVIGVYVLVVGWLGTALHREDDLLVSLVATGLVAVLFTPLRDRLQRAVSRLLYGQRAEPYTALARLGERLEGTLAPDAVLPTIVTTVREALRLPYAAIALPEEDGERVVTEAGDPAPASIRVPLTYANAEVGALLLAPRTGEAGFSPADRRLLSDLARNAGVAVSAVRLTADLQRSRELLVGAREEERRRLRRDLHDGLGAQLAGLTVQVGVLRSLIARDPAAAEELAGELRGELRTAIADIRRLVQGLRPPALDELGLTGALQRLAERAGGEGVSVTVEADDLPPLPAAVEVAVYRIVSEALTNVLRHAAARRCTVRLAVEPAELVVTVTDDGTGFAPGAPGVGLASMRERAAEMGGTCTVEAAASGGTVVRAQVPR